MEVNAHARTTDPVSSHVAALENAGRRGDQVELCVELVTKRAGLTSMEYASRSEHCRYMLARRLSDAAARGLIAKGPQRTCSVSERLSLTWLPMRHD